MKKCFLSIGLLLAGASLLHAAYPAPEKTGFANCILIYEQENRGPDELRCYVAAPDETGKLRWGFDAFLFLTLYHQGQETSYMKSDQKLWEHWLDRYFRPGKDIDALNRALESFGEAPPSKRQVIITIPWMSYDVTDFGDIDGDGVSEDLSKPADRAKVARWYIDLATARFKAQNYRHLELWGFYWMREDLVRDRDNARLVTGVIHEKGYKVMWIPYYYAPGWNQWRELGMDLAVMQSSYPFRSWIDRGKVRANRIRAVADAARSAGLGIEIEGRGLGSPEERRMLRALFDGGRQAKEGYQFGVQAYFLGFDTVERLARSADPDEKRLYHELFAYLNGQEVRLDRSAEPARWTVTDGERPHSVVAEAVLPRPGTISLVDLFFKDDDCADPWLGTLEIFVKEPGGGDWLPAGWAVGGNQDTYGDERGAYERGFRNVTAPVGGRAVAAVRAVITGQQRKLTRFELACDFHGPQVVGRGNLAYRKSYESTLPKQPAAYPDPEGRKLLDGVTGSRDYAAYIGWGDEPGSMFVSLELAGQAPFDEIRVHTRGGTHDAVNFPLNPCVVLSNAAPFLEFSGTGAIPDPAPVVLDYRELIETARYSEYDRTGCLRFPLPVPTTARYLAFGGDTSGWLMISELELRRDGRPLELKEASYRLFPAPTVSRNDSNFADGVRLTDGMVAHRAWFGQYYGWQGGTAYEFVVDLERPEAIGEATAWFVRDVDYGVMAPEEVSFSFSRDRRRWTAPVRAAIAAPAGRHGPLACRVKADAAARYVKVRVRGNPNSWAWTMMSEIEVR